MGFGVYTSVSQYMPLFSILCNRVGVLVVFITVYNDILLPSKFCACNIIVEYSISITLGENYCGKTQNGVGFYSGLTKGDFYAIIETSFTA